MASEDDDLPPAFASSAGSALQDFWEAYQAVRGLRLTEGTSLQAAFALPTHAPMLRLIPPDELSALGTGTYGGLRQAILEGRWSAYRRAVRLQGRTYARRGVDLGGWQGVLGAFQQAVMAELVVRHSAEPLRLTAALTALLAFTDFSLGLIAEAFLELRQGDRFRALVEAVEGFAIFLLDPGGRVASWNAGGLRLLGYGAHEILGQPMAIFHWCAQGTSPERALEVAAREGRFEEQAWRVRKNGTRFWAQVAISSVKNGEGELLGFAKVISDLSAFKTAFDRIADSERQLAEAQELAHLGSWKLDLKTRRVDRSPELLRIYGVFPNSLAPSPQAAQAIIHPDDRERVNREMEGAIGTLRSGAFDWRCLRPDGSVRILQSRVQIQRDANGEPTHIVGTVADLTELRQIEVALRERSAQLEASNRALEAFSYSVAHDLRAPLRGLHGFSQILLEDHMASLDLKGREALGEIQASANRMSQLIDALLSLSRTTRSELQREQVDLAALARDILAALARVDPQRIPPEARIAEPLFAALDPTLARTLLENLLGNAWKFTAKQPVARIELGGEVRNGERVYFVRDNGVGFDPRYVHKLFQPFQRLHASDQFPGTGVGLATVQRILERHGGRIWAESFPDQGATFLFTVESAPK